MNILIQFHRPCRGWDSQYDPYKRQFHNKEYYCDIVMLDCRCIQNILTLTMINGCCTMVTGSFLSAYAYMSYECPKEMNVSKEVLLQHWELLVLSKLKWDVAGVTAHDFLPLLLSRLPLRGLVDTHMVQRHAQTFISLAASGKLLINDVKKNTPLCKYLPPQNYSRVT